MEDNELKERLIDKSIEAFILGLEIYNKPTIKYRIEGFSFFICNAWELMLKAEMIIGNNLQYTYSEDLVNFIFNEIKKDPQNIVESLKKSKR